VREFAESTRTAAEAAASAGCEVAQTVKSLGHDRPLPTTVDASLRRFETVWCAAGRISGGRSNRLGIAAIFDNPT